MIALRPTELIITDGTGLTFSLFGKYQNVSTYSNSVTRELLAQILNTVDSEFTLLQPTAISGKGSVEIDTLLVANTTAVDITFTLWHTSTTTADEHCILIQEVKAGESVSITFDDKTAKSTIRIPIAISQQLSTNGENLIFSIYGKYEYTRFRELLFQGEITSTNFDFLIDDCNAESIFVFNPTGTDIDFQLLLENNVIIIDSIKAGQTKAINWTVSEGGGGGGTVESVVAGTNITVDNTDPANPIIACTVTSSNKLYIFNNLGRNI